MKVYVVFSGEYSGRHAFAVFSDKATAELHSDDVEEYDLDEIAHHVKQRVYEFQIYIDDGSQRGIPSPFGQEQLCAPHFRWSEVCGYLGFGRDSADARHTIAGENGAAMFAWGRSAQSMEEAMKLAAEARQKYLREQAMK